MRLPMHPFGIQPRLNPTHLPRFGQNNPFVLGVPGMGGFGGGIKPGPRIPFGTGRPQMPKIGMRPPMQQMGIRPQQFMRNPFMGQMRPY